MCPPHSTALAEYELAALFHIVQLRIAYINPPKSAFTYLTWAKIDHSIYVSFQVLCKINNVFTLIPPFVRDAVQFIQIKIVKFYILNSK